MAEQTIVTVIHPDEGTTELCFALPGSVAEALTRYTAETGCSWDDAATRAIGLLLMQTGYATREVNREYLDRTFPCNAGGAA